MESFVRLKLKHWMILCVQLWRWKLIKKAERQRSEKPYATKKYLSEFNTERINGMGTMKELDLKGVQQQLDRLTHLTNDMKIKLDQRGQSGRNRAHLGNIQCYGCGEYGHYRTHCATNRRLPYRNSTPSSN